MLGDLVQYLQKSKQLSLKKRKKKKKKKKRKRKKVKKKIKKEKKRKKGEKSAEIVLFGGGAIDTTYINTGRLERT